ncbi:MAG: EcsC family protein [Pseudomonadota bacterium]|nr:EcsC family protein [Pseudomonadota bacterium]
MASPFSVLLQALGERLDEDLLPAIYTAASVPTADVRGWMRETGVPFLDAEAGSYPVLGELDEAARRIVAQSRDRATAFGVASGFVGAVAIPPEVLATIVSTLRLAQRLAVVYGFDPEQDAGRIMMWRALAAAYEVELPAQGPVGLKMRELPDLLRSQVPATRQASAWLARQVIVRATSTVMMRVTRIIPGLGAGLAGWGARRRTHAMGERMIEVYRRAMTGLPFDLEGEEIAVEVDVVVSNG